MLTTIVFIIILGVLVLVHELGHFVVARRNGIKCDEFGFGFPPRAVGIQFFYEENSSKKKSKRWRVIWGRDRDSEEEKNDLVKAREDHLEGGTIYSLNWFPIGGFVKIKGEDGEGKNDHESFASKSAWTRIKVLFAGVFMNFVLAWLLLSFTFILGTYQDVTGENNPNAKVLVEGIEKSSPAEQMGMKVGDVIVGTATGEKFHTVANVQEYVNSNRGKEIIFTIERGKKQINLTGTPRIENIEGQGALGLSSIGEVKMAHFSLFESLWKGFVEIGNILLMMVITLKQLISGNKAGLEVTGVVGIAAYTGQIIPLGFSFLLRFAAILSVNLAFINALPIPALDGGRILFVLIEKIKGSPVSQKTEQIFHTSGFFILIALMIVVTYFDLLKYFR
jgi:regulator of sigma E protease